MSYGFSAVNTNNEIIISDEMENLHFIGKAQYLSKTDAVLLSFPEYSNSATSFNVLDGLVTFTFTITTTGIPVAFIKPTDYARWHTLLTQKQSGNLWTFVVAASGASSTPPSVYCFVTAEHTAQPANTYGLIVYKDDGTTRTFDSRSGPLTVTGAGMISPKSDPTNSSGLPTITSGHDWQDSVLDHDFRCSNRYNSISDSGANTSTAMFSAPANVQAVYKRQKEGEKRSCSIFHCQDHWSTAMWWAMYRSAFRLRSGHFDAGWLTYNAGYTYSSYAEAGDFFGFSSSTSYTTGTMPYTAKTINLIDNAYMIANSARYV